MQSVEQIIHGRFIITCDDNNKIFENAALIIKDHKIIDILDSKKVTESYSAPIVEHFNDHALLPGFINCHTHSAMALFRGLADDLELMDWLRNYMWPAETKWVSHDFVREGTKLAVAEMIRSGTTTFNDMYFFLPETAEVADVTGIRAHIGITIINVPTAWAKDINEYFEKGMAFYEQYANHPRIIPTMAPHSTYSVDYETLKTIKKLADDLKIRTNIHLQEAPSEMINFIQSHGTRPLAWLNDIGLVNDRLIAIHMTQLNDEDLQILVDKKPNIVHCPESNMKLGSGSCPVQKLLDLGVNVALGTDGAASNNDLDMISEMRSAAFLGKVVAADPRAASAKTVLRMATINGAKALGIDHLTGSLEKGKFADFSAIDLSSIETQPLYHPDSQIVYAGSKNQVTDVWVAGKRLLKNRELTTIDTEEVLKAAKSWQKKLLPASYS